MDNFTDKDLQGVYDPNKSDTEALKQAMQTARLFRTVDTASETDFVVIPYFVHEAEVMRMEKHSRRLWVIVLVLILALLFTNIAWLWYMNQYDFAEYDYEQDGYGVNIIGDGNGVNKDGATLESESADEEKP